MENKLITLTYYLKQICDDYIQHGFSSRGVNKQKLMNKSFVEILKSLYPNLYFNIEVDVESFNYNHKKKCDIVGYSQNDNSEMYIFPIKFVMSSYLKNRNNYFENLIGESYCLKQINDKFHIIPINIFLYRIPNMDASKNTLSYTVMDEKQFNIQLKLYQECKLFSDCILIIYDMERSMIKFSNIFTTNTTFENTNNTNTVFEDEKHIDTMYSTNVQKFEIFTPSTIVDQMIKQHLQYQISNESFLEPSCGKGNILIECLKRQLYKRTDAYEINQEYISYLKTDSTIGKLFPRDLQIFEMDFLKTTFYTKYDNIIMNPPYVKIQNIQPEYRSFLEEAFKLKGSYDVYQAFILKCLSLLSENGILTMIIPNSFLTNKSSKWIKDQLEILSITNYNDKTVFENVDVYVCVITCRVQKIQHIQKQNKPIQKICSNGIATLDDKIFIHEKKLFDEPCWKRILKVSKQQKMFCIYPYDDVQKILPEQTFKELNPQTYEYLLQHKNQLMRQSTRQSTRQQTSKKVWYAYGRTQNLKSQKGVFLSTLIQKDNIILVESDEDILYFNGIHIRRADLSKNDCLTIIQKNYNQIYEESTKRKNGWINLSVTKLDKYFQDEESPKK